MMSPWIYYIGAISMSAGALSCLIKQNSGNNEVVYPTSRLDTSFAEINISKINSDSRLVVRDERSTVVYHPSSSGLLPISFTEEQESSVRFIEATNIEHLSLRRIKSDNISVYMSNRR